MIAISRLTPGFKRLKNLFQKSKPLNTAPLSHSPLKDGLAGLNKQTITPKKDVLTLSQSINIKPSVAKEPLKSTSTRPQQTPSSAQTPLTKKEQITQLKIKTNSLTEIRGNVAKIRNNENLTPAVKKQLIQAEAQKLSALQRGTVAKNNASQLTRSPKIERSQSPSATTQASPASRLTQKATDSQPPAFAYYGQQRKTIDGMNARYHNHNRNVMEKSSLATGKPPVTTERKNPYINDALEKPASARPLSDDFKVVEGWNSTIIMNP